MCCRVTIEKIIDNQPISISLNMKTGEMEAITMTTVGINEMIGVVINHDKH